MSFPSCPHAKRPGASALTWLASEPYRIFFLSGILFSIAGVSLWPMLYRGMLDFYPGASHARVMVQAFGGGFVIGFLGTAGPRMLGAPKLTPWELLTLFILHLGNGICHLRGVNFWGDVLFLALLAIFIIALGVRLIGFRKELPPPPLMLAGVGLLCGLAGTLIWLNPSWMTTPAIHRLAGLLLYQGFLLAPIMGVGIFLFPRLLGIPREETTSLVESRKEWRNMSMAAVALLASFGIEVWVGSTSGILLRALAFVFALSHVRWIPRAGSPKAGTLGNALRIWSMPLVIVGLIAPIFFYSRHVAVDHMLFVGGFGLVCLIAGSRVLFGHSGRVERFANRSWIARLIVFTIVLAAFTRLSADFLPRVMVTHYEYAAASWVVGAVVWALWHAPRFFKKDESED